MAVMRKAESVSHVAQDGVMSSNSQLRHPKVIASIQEHFAAVCSAAVVYARMYSEIQLANADTGAKACSLTVDMYHQKDTDSSTLSHSYRPAQL